jgi:hypothetical protein
VEASAGRVIGNWHVFEKLESSRTGVSSRAQTRPHDATPVSGPYVTGGRFALADRHPTMLRYGLVGAVPILQEIANRCNYTSNVKVQFVHVRFTTG